MKNRIKYILGLSLLGVLFSASIALAVVLQGFGGGTGIGTATTTDVGNCLKVSSSSPYLIWTTGACSTGFTTSTLAGLTSTSWNLFTTTTPGITTSSPNNIYIGPYAAYLQVANNLSDLQSSSTARTNLGLGTAAVINVPISMANGGTGTTTIGTGLISSDGSALSSTTSPSVSNIRDTGIAALSFVATDANQQLVATGTPSGGVTSTSPLTSGYVPFATSSNSLTNSNIYQSSLKVGVGTTTPSQSLTVSGDFGLSGISSITTQSINATALTAGQCIGASTNIDSSVVSSTSAFITSPKSYPGAGLSWNSYIVSPGVLFTNVCSNGATGSPSALITLDATSTASGNSSSTIALNHTVTASGVASSSILLAEFDYYDNSTHPTISSVTYNGVAMTQAINNLNVNYTTSYWYLVNPAPGTHQLLATLSGANNLDLWLGGMSYNNVNLAAPINATSTATSSSGTTLSVNITPTVANSLILDSAFGGGPPLVSASTTQTQLYKLASANTAAGASSFQASSTSTKTMSWTQTGSASWTEIALALSPYLFSVSAASTPYNVKIIR